MLGGERARRNRLGRVWQAADGGLKTSTKFEFLEHPTRFMERKTHHQKGENKQSRLKAVTMDRGVEVGEESR